MLPPKSVPSNLVRPGSVVAIQLPLYKHFGVVTNRFHRGERTVISNSWKAGGVVEQPFTVFSCGLPIAAMDYPSLLPAKIVVSRATSRLGEKYSLVTWNCEHLIRYAHGLKLSSPQIGIAILAGLTLFALAR